MLLTIHGSQAVLLLLVFSPSAATVCHGTYDLAPLAFRVDPPAGSGSGFGPAGGRAGLLRSEDAWRCGSGLAVPGPGSHSEVTTSGGGGAAAGAPDSAPPALSKPLGVAALLCLLGLLPRRAALREPGWRVMCLAALWEPCGADWIRGPRLAPVASAPSVCSEQYAGQDGVQAVGFIAGRSRCSLGGFAGRHSYGPLLSPESPPPPHPPPSQSSVTCATGSLLSAAQRRLQGQRSHILLPPFRPHGRLCAGPHPPNQTLTLASFLPSAQQPVQHQQRQLSSPQPPQFHTLAPR